MNKQKILNLLLSSDMGMMFLLVNLVGIIWYSTLQYRGLPDGVVTVIGLIWTGKTCHGIFGKKK